MNRFTCALITVLALAASAPAFADDSTTSTEAGVGAGASGDATVGAGGAAGGMNANASAAVAGTMSLGFSPQLLYSAQTMPASALGLEGTLTIARITTPAVPPLTMSSTATVEGFGVGGAYGITDKITAGLLYSFALHPGGTIKGPLDLNGAYNVMHKDKMSLTVGADFNINVNSTAAKGIGLGASFKYVVAPKFAIFTGNPIPIGPAGDQLTFSLASKGPINLAIPAGVALQATPQVFAYLGMTLLNIGIANSSNSFLFKDQIGVNAGALYRATPELDVGVMIGDDFKRAGDAFVIGLTGRYYIHK